MSEIAAFIIGTKILDSLVMYPVTVILIAVFILSLNILWIPAMPTATDIVEVFTRDGKGTIFRWTKDSVSIVLTSSFLMWVVVSAFVIPVLYYPAGSVLYGPKGGNLLLFDMVAAIACLFVYLTLAQNLPERATVRAK